MVIGAFFMGGLFLFISQYLQLVGGLSPLRAGLWLVPPAIGMIIGSMAGPALAERLGRWQVITGGMAVTAVGFSLLTQVEPTGAPGLLVFAMVVAAVGLGPGAALVTDIVVGSAPPEKAGSAASLSETSGEFGIAMGVALLGSLGTALYRGAVTVPAEVSDEIAAAARSSLAGAVAATEQLPAGLAAQVLASAHKAFTTGLTTVAGLGAVAVTAFVAVALTRARRRPSTPIAAPEAAPPGVMDSGRCCQ
jgi:DHA2 family multidrug resistance protein-like MFS transporter